MDATVQVTLLAAWALSSFLRASDGGHSRPPPRAVETEQCSGPPGTSAAHTATVRWPTARGVRLMRMSPASDAWHRRGCAEQCLKNVCFGLLASFTENA
jgi:hypothetical protein